MEGKLRHKRETEAHRVPPSSVPFGVPVSLTGAGQAGRARLLRLLLRGAPRCGFGAFWGFLGFCFWGCRWVRGGLGGTHCGCRVGSGCRRARGHRGDMGDTPRAAPVPAGTAEILPQFTSHPRILGYPPKKKTHGKWGLEGGNEWELRSSKNK